VQHFHPVELREEEVRYLIHRRHAWRRMRRKTGSPAAAVLSGRAERRTRKVRAPEFLPQGSLNLLGRL
jgi:hypothetical protein